MEWLRDRVLSPATSILPGIVLGTGTSIFLYKVGQAGDVNSPNYVPQGFLLFMSFVTFAFAFATWSIAADEARKAAQRRRALTVTETSLPEAVSRDESEKRLQAIIHDQQEITKEVIRMRRGDIGSKGGDSLSIVENKPHGEAEESGRNGGEQPEGEQLLQWVPTLSSEDIDIAKESEPIIFVRQSALDAIHTHVTSDLKNEVGGFLIGETSRLPAGQIASILGVEVDHNQSTELLVIEIENVLPAKHTASTPIRVEFSQDTFVTFHNEREVQFPGKKVLGWYHTHPNIGIFLSNDDLFIYRYFTNTDQVALVVDPVRGEAGFFKRQRHGDPKPRQYCGFWELLEDSKPSALSWRNNLRPKLASGRNSRIDLEMPARSSSERRGEIRRHR